jgi:multidrug efflux system membrane fusion protein
MKKLIAAILILSLVLMAAGCSAKKDTKGKGKGKPVTVTTALAVQKDVPLVIKEIGTVEAYSTVSVISQANGTITNIYFKEGQDVSKGAPLFRIDSRPYDVDVRLAQANLSKAQTAVRQSEAALKKDQALLNNARKEADRYKNLLEHGVVTQQAYDDLLTNVQSLEASLEADKVEIETSKESVNVAKEQLDSSRIQQSYSLIKSPVSGRTGSLIVDIGNVIKANDRPLVSINQVNPINISFKVPEKEYAQIKQFMGKNPLQVKAYLDGDDTAETGTLNFIENAIDNNTGTLGLKAVFANKQHRLWPGQYVNVTLELTVEKNRVVVPTKAVCIGQQGNYIYVVKPDKSVESRPVTVDRTNGEESVIAQGIQAGEEVVTDGQLKIMPDSKVTTAQSKAGRK